MVNALFTLLSTFLFMTLHLLGLLLETKCISFPSQRIVLWLHFTILLFWHAICFRFPQTYFIFLAGHFWGLTEGNPWQFEHGFHLSNSTAFFRCSQTLRVNILLLHLFPLRHLLRCVLNVLYAFQTTHS